MKKRLKLVIIRVAVVLVCGIFYFFIGNLTGFFIACPFRTLTGLFCPGCGMTSLAVSLIRGNFIGAFYCNPVIFITLPFLIGILASSTVRFVKTGNNKLLKYESVIVWFCIFLLLTFCIYRNILLLLK